MINRYRYEHNKKKYQNLVEYTRNNPNLAENIKKEMLDAMEKYRFAITWMKLEDVKELIEQCLIEGSSRPLRKQLHCIGVGNTYNPSDYGIYNNDKRPEKEDEGYNLD